jgi:hypothetical protein
VEERKRGEDGRRSRGKMKEEENEEELVDLEGIKLKLISKNEIYFDGKYI